jgi:hypothetical protein
MRSIARALAGTMVALSITSLDPAQAQTVSLVGAWQTCAPSGGCTRFSFLPDGRVIKIHQLYGQTVTGQGRYRQQGNELKIVWTRFSPRRLCGQGVETSAGKGHCMRTAERSMSGPVAFDGFNALSWRMPDGAQMRLVRVQD